MVHTPLRRKRVRDTRPVHKDIHRPSLLFMRNNTLQPLVLNHNTHMLYRVHDEMRPTVLDLRPLVARAHNNDCRPRRDSRTEPGGRILEDGTARRVIAQLLLGEAYPH